MGKHTFISSLTLNVKAFCYICLYYEPLNLERRICVSRTNRFLHGETSVALSPVKRSFPCLSFLLPTAPFLCWNLCGAIERPLTFLCVCLITNLITNEAEHLSTDPAGHVSCPVKHLCVLFLHSHACFDWGDGALCSTRTASFS